MTRATSAKRQQKSSSLYKTFVNVDSHIEKVSATLFFLSASKKQAKVSLRIKRTLSTMVIVLLVSYSASPLFLKANTVLFYPTSCLGTWISPENAKGKPEEKKEVTALDSAILPANTQAELYCGSFEGDTPPGTIPQATKLSILWETRSKQKAELDAVEVLTASTTTIVSDNFASSTQAILDAPSDIVIFTSTSTPDTATTTDTTQGNESSPDFEMKQKNENEKEKRVPESTPPEEVQPSLDKENSTPANTEDMLPNPVVTETQTAETQPEVTPTPVSEPAPTPLIETPISYFDTDDLFSLFFEKAYAEEEGVGPTPEPTPVPSTPEAPQEVTAVVETAEESAQEAPVTTPSEPSTENTSVDSASKTEETVEVPDKETTHTTESTSQDTPTNTETQQNIQEPGEEIVPAQSTITPFVEVLYTFDGVNWTTLARVAPEAVTKDSFIIPYEVGTTWKSLKSLQIKIKSVQTIDETPALYVDAVELQIEHKKRQDVRLDMTQDAVAIDVDEETGQKVIVFGDEYLKQIKGITPYLAVVQIARKEEIDSDEEDSLWLYDVESNKRMVIATSTQVSSTFPLGIKGTSIFWLSSDKKNIYAFDTVTKTYQSQEVPVFDISEGERAEVFFDSVPWKIIIGGSNFFFWSEATGEVFSDGNSSALENFRKEFRLDLILSREEKEYLSIPTENE